MVAKEAIREAVRTQQDVVLVDTAGRMQVQLACLRLSFSHIVCTVTLEPFFRK
jgi:signal recognition particle GTPase